MKKMALTLVIFFSFFILLVGTPINAKESKSNYNNKFIIKLKTNEKYNSSLKKKIEDNVKIKIKKATKIQVGKDIFYSIELDEKFKDYKNIKGIEAFKEIAAMQPVYKYHVNTESGASPSSLEVDNWHVTNTNANALKAIPTENSVKVAVLDTGIDATHPALENVVDKELSYNFIANNKDYRDDLGHGTHVAGIIGAENDFSVGTNIDIVALRVLQYGWGGSDDIARAINYANKHKIPIINMSLGFAESNEEYAKDDLLYTALKNYDGLVVAAAGNEGEYTVNYPAAYSLNNIVSVASLDKSEYRSSFSNFHKTKADIFAPGTLVYSTCTFSLDNCKSSYDDEERVSSMSGTSMATPVVAGILGKTLAINPNLSTSELKDALIDSAVYSDKLKNEVLTDGRIDALEVYNHAILKKKSNVDSYASLDPDGSIELWGKNDYGQLGDETKIDREEDNKYSLTLPDEKITKYYINSKNIYLITEKGNLYVSGSNSYGQLGQTNSNDSTSFVKFIKVDNNHKIKSLSFRDVNGKYDENSLMVQLSGSKNYYKIGNHSFVAGKNTTAKTDKLQYVKHNKGFISTIYFYDKNSRNYKVNESRKYVNFEGYDDDWNPIEDLYVTKAEQKTITRKYDNYYTKENLYIDFYEYCGEEHFFRSLKKYDNKKVLLRSESNYYNVSCKYSYDKDENVVERKNITKSVLYYKKGLETYGYFYEYNKNGELKGNKKNFATKTYIKFNKNGYKTKIAHYKVDGKLTKYKYSGQMKTTKGVTKLTEYDYEFNFNKKKYTYEEYKGYNDVKKVVYKYKNNKKNSGYKLVYNSKGGLKGKANDYAYKQTMKYDKKGKLTLKKIAHYNKNGKRSKYQVQYQKIQTKKGYDVKKYSYKYKMKKTKMIHTKYENNNKVKELRYDYNKYGKLKSTSSSQAVLTIREYANNKLIKISYYVYDTNGNKYLAYYRYY